MEIVQIKPSNHISFRIPHGLQQKFIISNLTLRSVCIYVLPLHHDIVTVRPQAEIIQAFQEIQITLYLHWSQEIHNNFKSKIRVYIWESYDDEPLEQIKIKMFNRQTDGNCLMFEELTIQCICDPSQAIIPRNHQIIPLNYFIKRAVLPNYPHLRITQQLMDKVFSHCQKIGKVKAIYHIEEQYVIQFGNCDDIISSFCEVRDEEDNLAVFMIGCLVALGNTNCPPDYIILDKKGAPVQEKKNKIQKQHKIEKMQKIEKIKDQQQVDISKIPESAIFQNLSPQNFGVELNQQKKQSIQPKKGNNNRKNIKKDLAAKKSFCGGNIEVGVGKKRRRNKSQQTIRINIDQIDEQQEQYPKDVDLEKLKQFRVAKTFESKIKVQYSQVMMDLGKKVLNMLVSEERKLIYVLLRDCVIICPWDNISDKRVIKFDPIDAQNTHLPSPMLLFDREKTLIFGNQSYLFWISLNNSFAPDWKYVQRKQIYALQTIEELNLLVVGGKNFSKLSYLGKSTSRCNLKIYSCGKTGKREHLFTYDIPHADGQNVMELNYISSRPKGTKLLLMSTSGHKIYFLRVRAFNEIQIYSMMEVQEIGIQEIVSFRYNVDSGILICLQRLDKQNLCFKNIKIGCSYEKVQIITESIKLPVGPYIQEFRMGGNENSEWITAIQKNGTIWSINLQWKEPQKIKTLPGVKSHYLLPNGGSVDQLQTGLMFQIPKN